jgi:hypothetical protein
MNSEPEPVGWETEAEWELEMRCANITENTPFDEVSKLINDLWQQYCLAAEPKPEATEGGTHEKGTGDGQIYAHASRSNVPDEVVQASLDKARQALEHEKAVNAAIEACPMNYFIRARDDDERSQLYFEIMLAAYRAALTAKQTDGRE